MKNDMEPAAEVRETVAALADWLPERLFDAHAHLYCMDTMTTVPDSFKDFGHEVATPAVWRESLAAHVGESRVGGALFLPAVRI